MVVRVLDGRHLPDGVIESWLTLHRAEPTLASPFFHPEFTRIVAATRADVHVAVLEDAGFFPFQRGRWGRGRPVGSRLSDFHGLVASPDSEVDAVALLRECDLAQWEFDGLVAAQRPFREFHARTRESPVIDLAGGFAAYAQSRRDARSSILAEAATKAERLARNVGPLRFEARVDDAALLELLLEWKSAQYRRTGALDIFRFAWVTDVLRRAAAVNRPDFGGILSVLYAGTRPVALHFGVRSASVWHWWFPVYDPLQAKYSPGILLLEQMSRAAGELGLQVIDLGKGDALYKTRFANGATELAAGRVQRPSVAAAASRAEDAAAAILYRTPLRASMLRAATRRRLR